MHSKLGDCLDFGLTLGCTSVLNVFIDKGTNYGRNVQEIDWWGAELFAACLLVSASSSVSTQCVSGSDCE